MNCHNCNIPLEWDGFSPITVCGICHSFRSVDVPDETADRIVPLDRPGDERCPCCRRRLSKAAMDGLKVEHCAECDGVLMSGDVFSMFVRNRRTEFREAALQSAILVPEHLKQEVNCPHCRQTMNVHPCYGPNLIIIDACIDCGMVWLDCREMSPANKITV